MKKPKWVVEKEQARKAQGEETVWLFGLHAVRDALCNPRRVRLRLIVTQNAQAKLAEAIETAGMVPELVDARRFTAPIDPASVHQGAALEVKPLSWGSLSEVCIGAATPRVVLLDRVTDPHNVGAILRSAEVFGASARGTILHRKPGHWPRPPAAHWNANLICGCATWPMRSSSCRTWDTSFWGWMVRQNRQSMRRCRVAPTGPSRWCWGRRDPG